MCLKKTHSVVNNEVCAGDLLEALHDNTQADTAEVLAAAARKDVPQRRGICTEVRFRRNRLADAQIRLLDLRIGVRFAVERGDDRKSFRVAPVLGQPPWRFRQLRR